jgi:hypothetical protein
MSHASFGVNKWFWPTIPFGNQNRGYGHVLDCWKIYSSSIKNNFIVYKKWQNFFLATTRDVYSMSSRYIITDLDGIVRRIVHDVKGRKDNECYVMTLPWFDRFDRMLFWKLLLFSNMFFNNRSHCHFSVLILFVNRYL